MKIVCTIKLHIGADLSLFCAIMEAATLCLSQIINLSKLMTISADPFPRKKIISNLIVCTGTLFSFAGSLESSLNF